MKNNKLQFIYFDVGGVAILDFSKTNKWDEMLNDLRVPKDKRSQFDALFNSHENKICLGEDISIFIQKAKEELNIEFPKNYDMTADMVSRFEKNLPILDLFKNIKDKFRLGLLTAQYPNMLNMIFRRGLLPSDIWDFIIDSSVERVTKPDPEIYLLAEEKAGVEPESILFIDNKPNLLEFPKMRGWNTFLYNTADPIKSTQKLESFIRSIS